MPSCCTAYLNSISQCHLRNTASVKTRRCDAPTALRVLIRSLGGSTSSCSGSLLPKTLWVQAQKLRASATRSESPPVTQRCRSGCIPNTQRHLTPRSAGRHGEPRFLRLPHLPRFFRFTRGSEICALPPSIATYRPADFIALARPGKTRSVHMRHLRVCIQIPASGGPSTPSPNTRLGHLTQVPSTKMQNISSNVPSAMTSFIRRVRGIRFILFDDSPARHR